MDLSLFNDNDIKEITMLNSIPYRFKNKITAVE